MTSQVSISSINLGLPFLGPFVPVVWGLPSLFLGLIYQIYLVMNVEKHPRNIKRIRKEYDFIIVGAGSAGSVLANRLTENANDQVLLLEAGGDETSDSDVPLLAQYLQLTEMDWQYRTEPSNEACLGLAGKRCNWPRGKALGGSSAINYMAYVRGNRLDFDGWMALGNPGWGFDDVLPYFKKSEDNQNKYIAKNTKYHGTGGYLTVDEPRWRTPLVQSFLEAGVELGWKNIDFNSRSQTGFMAPQGTVRKGRRCSTSKAFLRPIRHRTNLHIAKYSFVMKVIIDEATMKATGVKVFRKGQIFNVYARKEVILSAGAINTPQLLMLSGVGPRSHLQDLGIPVIKDLPGVGQNLQDHVAAGGLVFLIDKEVAIIEDRYENVWSVLQYTFFGKGPLTIIGGLDGIAFVSTKYQAVPDFPDIELMLLSGSSVSDGGKQLRKVQGLSELTWRSYYLPIALRDTFNIIPMLMRPLSRGEIKLRSTNPFHKPLIYHKYYSDPARVDILTMIEGMKISVQVGRAHAFQKWGARLYTAKIPGCEGHEIESDAYYECLARHHTTTIYHYSGTAKMGPIGDPMAVVDQQLRVYGISNLRVIDASIMPVVTTGNTNAPTIMIGEKGSDLVKAAWY